MDSQNRGQPHYQKRGGGGRGNSGRGGGGGGGGGGQQRGRGRGSYSQGGPPPERGPPQPGGGPGPRGDYSSPPQRFQSGPRSVSPGQGPPGSQQFSRPSGPPPFSSAPAPWSRPEQQQPAREPGRPAWGQQNAPSDAPPRTQEPARDPGLPQSAQEGKAQGKRGKRGGGGGGKQSEAFKAPEPQPGPAPIQVSTDPALPEPQQAKSAGKGKGKKGGGAGDKSQGPSTPATPGPSQPSPTQEISKQTEKLYVSKSSLMIPRRPQGQNIQHREQFFERKFTLEVNYLPINFKDINLKIFHYDVAFNPERPKSLYRQALGRLLGKYVPNRHPAFDGKKNVYAGGTKLPFPSGDVLRDSVTIHDPERGNEATFDITVKLVDQDLSLSKLAQYLKTGTSVDIPQDVIQGVDIALRNAPVLNPNFIPVGRSFFAIPSQTPVYLGGGFDLWHGHYQSAIMSWKPYLNVDVANKAFPAPQSVIDFIYNDLELDPNRQMERGATYKLSKFLKGLKVDYKIKSNDPSGFTKRTYKVFDLGDPPNRHRFKPDKEGSREITVEQYFKDIKKIPLKFPHLPTILTTNKNNLPIEFCHITPNQAVMRKLDEKQTAVMVRNAAQGTDIRRDRIMRTIGPCNFNNDPCAKEFGITVNTSFEKVEAHVLRPPMIRYANGNVPVRDGVWQTRNGEKFINSPGLQSWAIINTDRKIGPQQINNLVKNFQQVGANIGIPVQEPRSVIDVAGRIRTEADFEREFRQFEKGFQILVVIMTPFGIDDIYSKIKRVAELKVGILTQCLKSNTCDFRKMNAMTAQNILLKINSKISGVNHALAHQVMPEILKKPVMIVGADVTHPAPGSEGLSIAAVAASHDKYAFQYNMMYRLQASRQEMIVDLQEMLEKQLKFFLASTGVKPLRILYYRDGVSEGQFYQVLDVELLAIRAACKKLEPGYEPAITFLVVQKRHHTRFFPGPKDWDGPKNKNVRAGTLVDTVITHPTEVDFYLVSHQSIQGTARPTKYHLLWDDNKIAQDELEQLTYYLCHMFARCNRSVSYPAPTYYAHLAAFRARAWWDGQRFDVTNLAGEQEKNGKIRDHIVNNAPMFFV